MPSPTIPPEFRRADWTELEVNTLVYRRGDRQVPIRDLAVPYRVVDPLSRTLSKLTGNASEIVPDEFVLVKSGPLIVIVTTNSKFTGIFTDIPAEVTVLGCKATDSFSKLSRPKALDSLPPEHAATLLAYPPKHGWPCLYGTWDVANATVVDDTFRFSLTNRLTVMALSSELLRIGKEFRVIPDAEPPAVWTFVVSRDVLHFIQSTCDKLLGDSPHVTR